MQSRILLRGYAREGGPLPLQPIPKTNNNTKNKTKNKTKTKNNTKTKTKNGHAPAESFVCL